MNAILLDLLRTLFLVGLLTFFHELGHYLAIKKAKGSPKVGVFKQFGIPLGFQVWYDMNKVMIWQAPELYAMGIMFGIPFVILSQDVSLFVYYLLASTVDLLGIFAIAYACVIAKFPSDMTVLELKAADSKPIMR